MKQVAKRGFFHRKGRVGMKKRRSKTGSVRRFLLIFLLAESVGLWYIHSGLNVAPGRLDDALFVFQVSIFTTCLGIVASPFQSLFIAHEQFRFQMVVDIVNSFVRLGCILLLTLYDGSEALRLYSLVFSLTSLNTLGIYYF